MNSHAVNVLWSLAVREVCRSPVAIGDQSAADEDLQEPCVGVVRDWVPRCGEAAVVPARSVHHLS